jgi:hypothetical protein
LEADRTASYADFDHYLYPAEFHQAIGMITFALQVDVREARRWIRHQAGATRQDLLVVARDIVARRLQITGDGFVGPLSAVTELSAIPEMRATAGDHRLGSWGAGTNPDPW